MKTIDWPWAILLCRFSDVSTEPHPVDYYEDLYTRHGTGGLVDYWNDVTHGIVDLSGSRVFGWLTLSHTSSEVHSLVFPGQRGVLVQWSRDAAAAAGINLQPFRQVLVVHNYGVDHGAAGNGIVIVEQDAALCEFGFISHEMGHGMGLPHSFAANPDWEYGDGWDVMSFATTTFQFPITFKSATGHATVGLNARNLKALGALEPSRLWSPPQPDFSATVVLDPLNQQQIGNHGHLVAQIPPQASSPARPDASTWTFELRHKAGWDVSIPETAVLLHQIRSNGLSYLQPGAWQRFTAGQTGTIPAPDVHFRVQSITTAPVTATLRIWDLPNGCLRREDSKPHVYLIENGTKRWVTSPAALFALGRTWDDVRVVPDGALSDLPAGPDVTVAPPPPMVQVPDLEEARLPFALTQLNRVRLRGRVSGPSGGMAWVAAQSPGPGTSVPEGSTVILTTRTGPIP